MCEQGPPLLRVHPQVLRMNFATFFSSFAVSSIGPVKVAVKVAAMLNRHSKLFQQVHIV